MMTAMPRLIGNEGLRNTLCDHVTSKDLAHAYILCGERGSGKHTAAWQLAAALSCESSHRAGEPLPCGTCPSCRKILSGKSPDVITVQKEGATMGVDVIRRLRTDAVLVPNDLEYKIYILEDAHTMTVQAQNAFLLTLEEPPSYVVFLLLCESTEPLLDTVKSRAPILRTRPVTRRDFDRYVRQRAAENATFPLSQEELDELYVISGGYIGRALALCDPKLREPVSENRALALSFLEACLSLDKRDRLVTQIQDFSSKRDELMGQLGLLEDALRDLILLKKSDEIDLRFFPTVQKAAALSDKTSLPRLFSLYEALTAAKEAIAQNANVKLTMIHLISNLW